MAQLTCKKKRKSGKVFFYCWRRVLWDPSYAALFLSLILVFALFLYLAVSYPKPNGPVKAYDLPTILNKIVSLESLAPSEEISRQLDYLRFLEEHPMSTANYAIYGFSGIFDERILTQEVAFRFVLYLPIFLFPLDLISGYALFGSEEARNDAKNLAQAMLTPKDVTRGKNLFHAVTAVVLYLIFSSFSFVLQRKGTVLCFGLSGFAAVDSSRLLIFVVVDGLFATLLFCAFSLFLSSRISSPIDFGIVSGALFLLCFGFAFFAWSTSMPFDEFFLLTFGCLKAVSNPVLLLPRYGVALFFVFLFVFLSRLKKVNNA